LTTKYLQKQKVGKAPTLSNLTLNLEHKKRYNTHGYRHRWGRSLGYLDWANHR